MASGFPGVNYRLHKFVVAFAMAVMAAAVSPPLSAQDEAEKPAAREGSAAVPPELTLRIRVTAITPSAPVTIAWLAGQTGEEKSQLAENLPMGEWSKSVPVASLASRFRAIQFVTFLIGDPGKSGGKKDKTRTEKTGYSKDVQAEFEFSYKLQVIKTCKEQGPDGGTIGMVIPTGLLAGGKAPTDPAFLAELGGLLGYAQRRADKLEALPWAKQPLPKLFMVAGDLKGYGEGMGRGVLCSDKAVLEAECRSLRQLGVNTLRSRPQFLDDMAASRTGVGAQFTRGRIEGIGALVYNQRGEGVGCPYAPGTDQRTADQIADRAMGALKLPVEEVYGLTRDEISPIFNNSREGRPHPAVCPYCAEAFRAYVKGMGLTPADFGQADWPAVKPIDYWTWTMGQRGKTASKTAPSPATKPQGPTWLTDKGAAMTAYCTALFTNYGTAASFTPLREAYNRANEAKRQALAEPGKQPPAATQPWVHSYALRNPHFIDAGDGLDCFDFYRYADNAFVFETSSSVPQCLHWDGYLCDAARVVTDDQRLKFGVYVKPARGASPIQRAITAISRNAQLIYWYNYGPDWAWSDNFSQRIELMAMVSRAARLIAKSEEVLYGSTWATPAEVAVVTPRSSEIWMRLSGEASERVAAWENAKWTYTALAHAHIPVDPLDEVMLATKDLSRYKVIYVSGPNITRAAAAKLAEWVKSGGTLYTSGGGLARDEANQPLETFDEVLGLRKRNAVEMWTAVTHDGAKAMADYAATKAPEAAKITGSGPFKGSFAPVVGREVLLPAAGTEVLAKFGDGDAATRHAYGKGQAFVVGFFPGLEYQAKARRQDFDLTKDFDADRRSYVTAPALAAVKPVVDASEPLVEGVLLKNSATGKRAVTLVNWAFRIADSGQRQGKSRPAKELVAFKDLKVTIRGAGDVAKAVSAATGKPLQVTRTGGELTVVVPVLEEADVLLLE